MPKIILGTSFFLSLFLDYGNLKRRRESFDYLIALQMVVYLLENMGVKVGINPQLTNRQMDGRAFSVSKSICITEIWQ